MTATLAAALCRLHPCLAPRRPARAGRHAVPGGRPADAGFRVPADPEPAGYRRASLPRRAGEPHGWAASRPRRARERQHPAAGRCWPSHPANGPRRSAVARHPAGGSSRPRTSNSANRRARPRASAWNASWSRSCCRGQPSSRNGIARASRTTMLSSCRTRRCAVTSASLRSASSARAASSALSGLSTWSSPARAVASVSPTATWTCDCSRLSARRIISPIADIACPFGRRFVRNARAGQVRVARLRFDQAYAGLPATTTVNHPNPAVSPVGLPILRPWRASCTAASIDAPPPRSR